MFVRCLNSRNTMFAILNYMFLSVLWACNSSSAEDSVKAPNEMTASDYISRGNSNWENGRNKEALQDYTMATTLEKENAKAWCELAMLQATCMDESIRDPKTALRNAFKASQLSKFGDASVMNCLATAYAANGDFDNAVLFAKYALLIAGRNRQVFPMAGELLTLFEHKVAYVGVNRERLLDRLPDDTSDPDSRFVNHLNRANSLIDERKYSAAVDELTIGIAAHPGAKLVYLGYALRGTLYERFAEYDSAIADATLAIDWWPKKKDTKGGLVAAENVENFAMMYLIRGFGHLENQQKDKAADDFRIATQLNPKFAATTQPALNRLEGGQGLSPSEITKLAIVIVGAVALSAVIERDFEKTLSRQAQKLTPSVAPSDVKHNKRLGSCWSCGGDGMSGVPGFETKCRICAGTGLHHEWVFEKK